MAKSMKKRGTSTGRLRIGSQRNAINIIASSQTHPLKAVCELAENAIDARAEHVQLVRRRTKGQVYLEVVDDGNGIVLTEDGQPNFAHIATHVCDSMKRHLNGQERTGVHGEYGIGLLSFWSLGEELRMVSAGEGGNSYEMLLKRGKTNYAVRPLRGQMPSGGTRVVVGPLLESTRNIVTGEKLLRFLAAELRDRIRNTGVKVQIVDRVSRKTFIVTPREFEGERVDVPQKISTSFGDVLVELYFPPGNTGSGTGIAVCKDGTRVLKDITELGHFERSPWSEQRVEGVFDFVAFNLAPGTRQGIVPDERLQAFIAAVRSIEPELITAFGNRDQAETEAASRQILRQVHRAFANALRELPSNEYLFFDLPKPSQALGKNPSSGESSATEGPGVLVSVDSDTRGEESVLEQKELLPLEPGPLAAVGITPRHARRRLSDNCRLTAKAVDENKLLVSDGVDFVWKIAEGDGTLLEVDAGNCQVTSSQVGQVLIDVRAVQSDNVVTDQVAVKFLENIEGNEGDSGKGLPSYRLEPEHGKPWRSRYDGKLNEIIINSVHPDFVASRTTGAKHRRYVGKLYAKEVVLINFPHESPSEVMERLIQLTLRTEDVL